MVEGVMVETCCASDGNVELSNMNLSTLDACAKDTKVEKPLPDLNGGASDCCTTTETSCPEGKVNVGTVV